MPNDDFASIYELPIASRQAEILAAIESNQVTIITAETGAGKSTQVPQYLAEASYRKIIVTQPRILAARNLSNRVRQEYSYRTGTDATNLVGYRTAHERDDNPDTVILYCTDGLQLVRELTGAGTTEQQILVLDEVHEWNENMEVLVAWAKKRCQEDPNFKLVLMSATIDSAPLAEYYGSPQPIAVVGRSFPVESRTSTDLIAEIIEIAAKQTANMLVFLPGKSEIEQVMEAVTAVIGDKIPILPLHSQLEPEQQQLAFAHYSTGKIVLSTNIAQTSVTIDDIDVVIDSGLERRAEVRSGVEGLFIAETSQADCQQRAGRAGRTKPGLYVLAKLGLMPCSPIEERPEYGIPEILRKHIDRLVLRLASIGIDIEELDFFHAPSRKTIKLAKLTLVRLGALTRDQQVTNIGREMERFPVESSYARMLVEAQKYAEETQAKVAAMIAIQEVGGIVRGGPRFSGWRAYTRQSRSDLIAQYDVYLAAPTINEADYEELGIISKNVDKAAEIIERLNSDLQLSSISLTPVDESELDDILRCIVAGQLHQIWRLQPDGKAEHIVTGKVRELSSSSVVRQADLIAGTAFDLQVPTPEGLQTLKLVNDLTVVDPAWLADLAPDNFKVSRGKLFYNPKFGALATRTLLTHNGNILEVASTPVMESTPENSRLFTTLYGVWAHDELEKQRRSLQVHNKRRLPEVPLKQVQQQVRHIINDATSLYELSKSQKIELSKQLKYEYHLPKELAGRIKSDSPKSRAQRFKQRWKFNPRKQHRPFRRHTRHDD